MSGFQQDSGNGEFFSLNGAESEITILKDCYVDIDGTFATNVIGTELVLSKNQATLPSITNVDVLDYGYNQQAANYVAEIGFSGDLKAGDVLRFHCGAGMSISNTCKLSMKASLKSNNVVYQGTTSQLDTNSYTPTFQGFGTVSNVDFTYRQEGDSIVIQGFFTSGTPTATEAQISLPNGYTIKGGSQIKASSIWYQGGSNYNWEGGSILLTDGEGS